MHFSKLVTSPKIQKGKLSTCVCTPSLPTLAVDLLTQLGITKQHYEYWQAWLGISKYELSIKHVIDKEQRLKVTGRFGYWRPKSFTMVFEIYDASEEILYAISTIVFHFMDKENNILPVPVEFRDAICSRLQENLNPA